MTLNQVIDRIRRICLAHKQVRTFDVGQLSNFLVAHTTKYPAVFLQDNGGIISTSQHAVTLAYRMWFLDLVHVSQDTKMNELDVLSDMLSVALDIVAQMNSSPLFLDWKISTDNNLQQQVTENEGDMNAGWVLDFSVSFIFRQDRCKIPSVIIETEDMKLVYDVKYVANGDEGLSINLPEIVGKKLLLVTREFAPLYKVSSSPTSSEFTWNDVTVGLGAIVGAGERFLFLYRTY